MYNVPPTADSRSSGLGVLSRRNPNHRRQLDIWSSNCKNQSNSTVVTKRTNIFKTVHAQCRFTHRINPIRTAAATVSLRLCQYLTKQINWHTIIHNVFSLLIFLYVVNKEHILFSSFSFSFTGTTLFYHFSFLVLLELLLLLGDGQWSTACWGRGGARSH